MQGAVYLLCAAISVTCSALLWRAWRESRVRLLLWSAICFGGLAIDNLFLYLDRIALPDVELSLVPNIVALISVSVLLFGLIWEET